MVLASFRGTKDTLDRLRMMTITLPPLSMMIEAQSPLRPYTVDEKQKVAVCFSVKEHQMCCVLHEGEKICQ